MTQDGPHCAVGPTRRQTLVGGLAGLGALGAGQAWAAAAPPRRLAPGETVAPFALPPLRYGYAAMEPVIDEATLRRRHDVIHRGYVDRVNAALAKHPQWLGLSIEDVMNRLAEIPEDIRAEVRLNGGGHANNQFHWKIVGPPGGPGPSGALLQSINNDYGSLAEFQRQFDAAALALAGPGWVFAGRRGPERKLEIMTLPNNDSLLWAPNRVGATLCCDLWEHAHMPRYASRADWLKAFWQVADWRAMGERFGG